MLKVTQKGSRQYLCNKSFTCTWGVCYVLGTYDVTLSVTERVLSKNPGYSTSFCISTTYSSNPLLSPLTEGQYWAQVSCHKYIAKNEWLAVTFKFYSKQKGCYV